MHCFRTGVEKGMKLRTAVQEGCGYKETLRAHRYFALLAKYFTVCITYQPPLVQLVYFGILCRHFGLLEFGTSNELCFGGQV